MNAIDPKPGDVYVSRELDEDGQTWRRVIQVFQGHVFYSVGADLNRQCKMETFQRWARKAKLLERETA